MIMAGTDPRWRLSPTKIVVAVILRVAIVVPLLVGSYARVEPRLFGFPFFFWYQLVWVFLAALACADLLSPAARPNGADSRRPAPAEQPGARHGTVPDDPSGALGRADRS